MLIISKKDLRKHFIDLRNNLDSDYRISADENIASKLFETAEYSKSELIFVYVSVNNEIDTKTIIEKSFTLGKKVAVPFCQNSEMFFYPIKSFDDLTQTQFGIPTIDPAKSEFITDFSNALCIVPALSFDRCGNRLGYGGGYYDRFLAGKHIETFGLCREKQLTETLPAEDFDVKISKFITENKIVEIQEV